MASRTEAQTTNASSTWSDRSVVVTGGAGFIGSWLCERLLSEGAYVHCIDSFITGRAANVAHLADHPRFHLHRSDISDRPLLAPPASAVFHLASIASPIQYAAHPLETLRVGSTGTEHVLEYATAVGARVVLASSSEVYGVAQEHPQREEYWGHVNPIGPRSVYDESKRFSEALAMGYHRERGTDVVIARIFNTYGPRMDSHDGRAVPTFVRQALAGEPLTVAGDGSQTRSMCWVGDTVDGLIRLAEADGTGPFNLGNPDEISMMALARHVLQATGSPSPIASIPRPEDDPHLRRPDIARITRATGWAPTTPLADGLHHVVEFMSERGRSPTAGTEQRTQPRRQ